MNIELEDKCQLLSTTGLNINNGDTPLRPPIDAELVTSPSGMTTSSSQFFKENAFQFSQGTRKLTGFEPAGSAKCQTFPLLL